MRFIPTISTLRIMGMIRALMQLGQLDDRMTDIEKAHKELAKAMEQLDDEWTDQLDKFRTLHARIAKRQSRLDASENPERPNGKGRIPPREMLELEDDSDLNPAYDDLLRGMG